MLMNTKMSIKNLEQQQITTHMLTRTNTKPS